MASQVDYAIPAAILSFESSKHRRAKATVKIDGHSLDVIYTRESTPNVPEGFLIKRSADGLGWFLFRLS
ncbi:MAG: hypothetical protein NVSMB14_10200 [Isosphaeraceae bacterium]